MQAGLLREIIEIYEPKVVVNSFGEQEQEYILLKPTKARVIHSSGSKAVENNEIVSNYSKTFHVRMYVPMSETYQIKYQGNMYSITSIEDVPQFNYKEIIAERINV